jgi:hypothetical protein
MATAICRVPTVRNGVHSMNTIDNNQLRPDLQKIVEDIIGLRQLTATTGFMTFKEIKVMLERLSSEDKSLVGRELTKREQKQQPIYDRTK